MIRPTELEARSLINSFIYIIDDKGGDGGRIGRQGWNSIIGIVTAICGNVLISVALNVQRYAHIKLNEKAAQRRRLLRRAERRGLETTQEINNFEERDTSNGNGRDAKENLQRIQRGHKSNERRQNGRQTSGDENEYDEQRPLLDGYQTPEDGREDESDSNSPSKQDDDSLQNSYLRSPYWWAGIILMTVGEGGNFLAYGFAPASIVSPLGVVAIVSNCIIAPIFMKEPFRWRDFIGVLVAIGGVVTVVLSASENNPKLGPHEMWDLIARWEFETYLAISVAVIICLMLASNKYGQKSIFIDIGLVGLFGGYTALSTKGVASLLSYTLFEALTFPIFYLLIAILVGTAVMQIKYINRALQRFESTQVIPTQFVMFTLSVILGSAVLYRDFEKTQGDAAGKFIGGCALTFLGVWLITSGRPPAPDNESDFDEDEDAIVLRPGEQYQDDIHVNAESRETLHPPLVLIEDEDEYGNQTPQTMRQRQSSHLSSVRDDIWDSESAPSTPRRPALGHGTSSPTLRRSGTADSMSPGTVSTQSSRRLQRFLQPIVSLFPDSKTTRNTAQTLPSVLQARHSTPALPTVNNLDTSNTLRTPHTPRQDLNDTPTIQLEDSSATGARRGHLANRHSLNNLNLYPGPFSSPLSSSLSAMVSESLRRGIGIKRMKRRKSQRPPISGMESSATLARQRGHSGSALAPSSSYPDHDNLLPAFEDMHPARRYRSYSIEYGTGGESEPQTPVPSRRPRGLSVRLSEFFGISSGKPETEDDPPV